MILQNLAKDCQTLAKSKIFEQTLKPCESMKSIFSSVIMKLIWLFFINFNFFQLINAETEIRFLIKNLVLQLTEHEAVHVYLLLGNFLNPVLYQSRIYIKIKPKFKANKLHTKPTSLKNDSIKVVKLY